LRRQRTGVRGVRLAFDRAVVELAKAQLLLEEARELGRAFHREIPVLDLAAHVRLIRFDVEALPVGQSQQLAGELDRGQLDHVAQRLRDAFVARHAETEVEAAVADLRQAVASAGFLAAHHDGVLRAGAGHEAEVRGAHDACVEAEHRRLPADARAHAEQRDERDAQAALAAVDVLVELGDRAADVVLARP
jgi:hypothetical protein